MDIYISYLLKYKDESYFKKIEKLIKTKEIKIIEKKYFRVNIKFL